jgi:hypothetical protein
MITKRHFFTTIAIILFVNVFFIAGIIIFFNNHYSNKDPDEVAAVEQVYEPSDFEYAVSEAEEDPIDEVDIDSLKSEKNVSASYIGIYSSLLPGTYVLDDEQSFVFNTNGTFSGYFDDDHRHVEGYSYTISEGADSLYRLTISSPNGMSSVDYFIGMTADGNVELLDANAEELTVLYTLVSDGTAYAGCYSDSATESEETSKETENPSDDTANVPKG